MKNTVAAESLLSKVNNTKPECQFLDVAVEVSGVIPHATAVSAYHSLSEYEVPTYVVILREYRLVLCTLTPVFPTKVRKFLESCTPTI